MTEDNLKPEDKSRSDLSIKKKSSQQLFRSHSCRKSDLAPRPRRRLSRGRGRGSAETVVTPGEEDELLDIVDDNLQHVTISMKCQKGFSTRTIPSI